MDFTDECVLDMLETTPERAWRRIAIPASPSKKPGERGNNPAPSCDMRKGARVIHETVIKNYHNGLEDGVRYRGFESHG